MDLADEAVDIDDQTLRAGSRAGLPRACQRDARHAVKLAHVPERKRPQKRAQRRRRRDPAAQPPTRTTGPQHLAVIDAVRPERHRIDQRHDLAPGVVRARPIRAQAHEALRESLDSQPLRERCDEHDPRVCDRSVVIKGDLHSVQSDRPVIVHHEGDLLRGPRLRLQPEKALVRRSFFLQHRTTPPTTAADQG